MAITFQIERWADYARDAAPLWREHYDEIAADKDRMKMAPDAARFEALDAGGQLLITTARRDGRMIGYVVMILAVHMHYAETPCVFEDAYFLSPSERRGEGLNFRAHVGVRLIEAAIENAKAAGAKKLFFHTKEIRSVAVILKRLGMKKCDELYTMWIG